MVYLDITFNQNWGTEDTAVGKAGPCLQSPDFAAFSTERARDYYGAGAQKRIDMEFNSKEIDALDQDVQRNGGHFAVVLLPDPNALLPSNRERFRGVAMNWGWIRQYMSEKAAGRYALLDLSDVFQDRPDLFRCNDTHWSDDGNVHAADVVAKYFARSFGEN